MKKIVLFVLFLAIIIFFCFSRMALAVMNISGSWYIQLTNGLDTCGESVNDEAGSINISQSGNNISFYAGGAFFSGTVTGSTIVATAFATAQKNEDGGTTDIDINITFYGSSGYGNSGDGTDYWEWTDGYTNCQGRYDVSLSRYQSQSSPASTSGGRDDRGGCFLNIL